MNTAKDADMEPIPKGTVFVATRGEYSDYAIAGIFQARAVLHPLKLKALFYAENPEQEEHFDDATFLAFLTRKGLIDQITASEWHLSDYGSPRFAVTDLTNPYVELLSCPPSD